MNRAAIQAKIWSAYAKSAVIIGDSYQFYRPTSPLVPVIQGRWDAGGQWDGSTWDAGGTMDSGGNWDAGGWDGAGGWDQSNSIFSLPVSLNAEDMTYKRPNKYGKATWYALFDGTNVEVGDYFSGPMGTFFVAAMQPLLPILAVSCNRIASFYRPQAQTGTGIVGYGGNTADNETLIGAGRPCSILQGTKGEKSDANLPGDTRNPWWYVLLPYSGIDLAIDDIVVDDLNRRYVVSSPELTALGWRLSVMTSVP